MAERPEAPLTRIVASPAALDAFGSTTRPTVRIAPDELLVLDGEAVQVEDPWAIVEPDSGWMMHTFAPSDAMDLFSHHASWTLPTPAQPEAQGKAAGLPIKACWHDGSILICVPAAYEVEFERRIGTAP